MDDDAIFEQMLALADEVGLEVRVGGGRPTGEDGPPLQSGVCRLRDRVWVVLSSGDAPSVRMRVLAGALKSHCGEALEGRYLPPQLRSLIEEAPGSGLRSS